MKRHSKRAYPKDLLAPEYLDDGDQKRLLLTAFYQ